MKAMKRLLTRQPGFFERLEMISTSFRETVAITMCRGCGSGTPASDNYCRQCGVLQKAGPAIKGSDRSEYETRAIGVNAPSYRGLSKSLLDTITKSVAVKTTPIRSNRFGARLFAVVVAVPIWLLIVLLSPLDAYTTARVAMSRVDYL
jgi:hypothetical protein